MPLQRVHLEVGLLAASTARLAYELAGLGRGLGESFSLRARSSPHVVGAATESKKKNPHKKNL